MTYEKAVTSTQYYDEIARRLIENGLYSDSLTPAEMADAVEKIAMQKYSDGLADGEYAGKSFAQDEFWDSYQDNGKREFCQGMFSGKGWTAETLKPQHNMSPSNAMQMFWASEVADVSEILKKIDFSNCGNMNSTFGYTNIEHIGCVRSARTVYGFDFISTFSNSKKLHTIDCFGVTEILTFTNTFLNCEALANIIIEGTIGNNISFAQSPLLTHDSLMSIIDALKDLTGTGITRTLTLHPTAKARLSEEDIAIGTQKGWTIA